MQFRAYVEALNKQFLEWVQRQWGASPTRFWSTGLQDYLRNVRGLACVAAFGCLAVVCRLCFGQAVAAAAPLLALQLLFCCCLSVAAVAAAS